MSDWQKLETGWYRHKSGGVVQSWGRLWHAWRAESGEYDYRVFRTMREAREYALGAEKKP